MFLWLSKDFCNWFDLCWCFFFLLVANNLDVGLIIRYQSSYALVLDLFPPMSKSFRSNSFGSFDVEELLKIGNRCRGVLFLPFSPTCLACFNQFSIWSMNCWLDLLLIYFFLMWFFMDTIVVFDLFSAQERKWIV